MEPPCAGKTVKFMKVLNFGSLNIDYVYSLDHFVQKGETISSNRLNIFSGGKGLNQSIAMGRAGISTWHAGAIGPDGQFLLDLLEASGVNTEFVRRLEETRTGNAIIQKDKNGDNCIILYGGANQAITRKQVEETISHFGPGDCIVLQNEINEMPYIMEQAHKQGMTIVLNPSPMDGKIFEMPLSYVDYFILNEIEAGQILGRPGAKAGEGEELAAQLAEKFPGAKIVLTLGGEGSVYTDGSRLYRQSIYRTKTVDTTAAGDTFTGYFIAGILTGCSVEDSMDLAARAAAITVSGEGAAPSIPDMKTVKERVFEEKE